MSNGVTACTGISDAARRTGPYPFPRNPQTGRTRLRYAESRTRSLDTRASATGGRPNILPYSRVNCGSLS